MTVSIAFLTPDIQKISDNYHPNNIVVLCCCGGTHRNNRKFLSCLNCLFFYLVRQKRLHTSDLWQGAATPLTVLQYSLRYLDVKHKWPAGRTSQSWLDPSGPFRAPSPRQTSGFKVWCGVKRSVRVNHKCPLHVTEKVSLRTPFKITQWCYLDKCLEVHPHVQDKRDHSVRGFK